jgi:hypothetical protein
MGEAIRRSGVPKWVWSGIFTLLLGLMTFGVAAIAGNQKIKDDIDKNTNDLESKANSERVDAIEKENDRTYDIVVRIEAMMIEHMQHD